MPVPLPTTDERRRRLPSEEMSPADRPTGTDNRSAQLWQRQLEADQIRLRKLATAAEQVRNYRPSGTRASTWQRQLELGRLEMLSWEGAAALAGPGAAPEIFLKNQAQQFSQKQLDNIQQQIEQLTEEISPAIPIVRERYTLYSVFLAQCSVLDVLGLIGTTHTIAIRKLWKDQILRRVSNTIRDAGDDIKEAVGGILGQTAAKMMKLAAKGANGFLNFEWLLPVLVDGILLVIITFIAAMLYLPFYCVAGNGILETYSSLNECKKMIPWEVITSFESLFR